MRWPIRNQLLAPLLTLLLGVVGISSWTAYASAQRARRQIENQVREIAKTLDESEIPLNEVILKYMHGLSGAEFLLVGGSGIHISSLTMAEDRLSQFSVIGEGVTLQNVRLGNSVTIAGTPYLATGLRLRNPKRLAPGGPPLQTLYVFYPESLWRDALREAVRPSLIVGGFVGFASLALAFGVSQRIARRIQELERRTRLIAQGNFELMPLAQRQDELRDLGQSVNEMAARLAQLQETVQKTERLRLLGQLGGGLAHQLRNGIAGARLAIQLYSRDLGSGSVPVALDVALRQLTLLEAHLRQFLQLGRHDSSRHERCQLGRILEDVRKLLEPQARHSGITWHWHPPENDVALTGDPIQLSQIFLNLITNGIEAAGPGGWIRLQARTISPGISLSQSAHARVDIAIVDSGSGPSVEMAPRLFELFATGKPEGVGLGLVAARQIAEDHGGSVTWDSSASQTTFVVRLPVLLDSSKELPA